jgi:hypothetical protein
MPFREQIYRFSCAACPELTDKVCPLCEAPACQSHLETEMCTHCSTVFLEELTAAGLTTDDLKFGTPPDASEPFHILDAWNDKVDRAYKGRFLLQRLRKSRRKFTKR